MNGQGIFPKRHGRKALVIHGLRYFVAEFFFSSFFFQKSKKKKIQNLRIMTTDQIQLTEQETQELQQFLESLDLSDLESKYSVSQAEALDNVVVIANLPIVDSAKEEKLVNVIKKIFKNCGTVKEGGIYMPKEDKTGKSKGYLLCKHGLQLNEIRSSVEPLDSCLWSLRPPKWLPSLSKRVMVTV